MDDTERTQKSFKQEAVPKMDLSSRHANDEMIPKNSLWSHFTDQEDRTQSVNPKKTLLTLPSFIAFNVSTFKSVNNTITQQRNGGT